MDNKVAAIAATPDPGSSQRQPAVPFILRGELAEAETGRDPADVRLVIELDEASGMYVYKTVDRETGEVLQQLPRPDVLKLREGPDYATGSVIRTKA